MRPARRRATESVAPVSKPSGVQLEGEFGVPVHTCLIRGIRRAAGRYGSPRQSLQVRQRGRVIRFDHHDALEVGAHSVEIPLPPVGKTQSHQGIDIVRLGSHDRLHQ